MAHSPDKYRLFVQQTHSPDTSTYCAAGSARFVIHPTGKITRCFGQSIGIGNIYDGSIDFILDHRVNSQCNNVSCFDPCDFDCAEKWTSGSVGDNYFPIQVPWMGNLIPTDKLKLNDSRSDSVSLDLIQINLTPTLLCNYKCSYCIAGSNVVDPKAAAEKQLDPQIVIKFLEKILIEINPMYGILLYVSGGEPLIWPGIIELGNFISRSDRIVMKLNTNGSHRNQLEKLLCEFKTERQQGRIYIQVSAHTDQPKFSRDGLISLLHLLEVLNIKHRVSMVKDASGVLTEAQREFASHLRDTPLKIYSDYRIQDEFEFERVFLDELNLQSARNNNSRANV